MIASFFFKTVLTYKITTMKKYIILLLSICGALVNAQDLFSGTIYYEETTERIP